MYIAEAKNFALGLPYRETGFVWVPGMGVHNPASYPPVFPLILAPFYAWFGNNLFVFKIVVQVLLLAALPFYYAIGRAMHLGRVAAAVATIVFGLSAVVLETKESVGSDTAYLLFAGAFLYATLAIYSGRWDKLRPVISVGILTIVFLLAYGTRSAGLTLPIAFLIHEIVSARRLRPFGLLAAGSFMLAMSLFTVLVYDSREYGNQFVLTFQTCVRNAAYYFRSPAELWEPLPGALRYGLTVLAIGLAALAMVRRLLRFPSIVEFYSLISIGLAITYAAGMSARYLLPFLALLPFYIFDGLRSLIVFLPERHVRAAWAIVCSVFLCAAAVNVASAERGPVPVGVGDPGFIALCDRLRIITPPDAVLVSWNPRVFSLYTGRRGTHYPHSLDVNEFSRLLELAHADHAILYRDSAEDLRWLQPFINSQGPAARLIYDSDEFRVYRLSSLTSRRSTN
jgi:hypothetical protein